MKSCARCGLVKDDDEFNWRWKSLGVRQPICKDCSKLQRHEHYLRYQGAEIARTYEVTKERRERAKRFIYEYLSVHRCVDCGEYDFAVLTFDHVVGEKKMDISKMVSEGYAIESILEEISRCEVVCSNCHMRREAKRRSGGRFRKFWPKFPWED